MKKASNTREQLLKQLDLLEELKRRKRASKALYRPNEGQHPVHASNSTLRAVFAGNGGGKTALGVHEAWWAVTGYNPVLEAYSPVPARVIVVLDKPDKVAEVWLPELKKWFNLEPEMCKKQGKPYVSQIQYKNGSTLTFMFHDQDPMTFESVEVDTVVFDEPPPRHVYIALRRGGRKKGRKAKYLIIGTPITGSWLRKEIYEPWAKGESKGIDCFRFGTQVNEANLAEGYIEEFSSVLSEKEKRIRLEGEFFDLEGLALAHLFTREDHIIPAIGFEWDNNWPVVIGIDPHPNKAHIAVMLGCMPDGGYIFLRELSSNSLARDSVPSDFARELKRWYQGYRVVDIICDSLGSGSMTGGEGNKSFIEVLNQCGVRARATSWEDKKEESWVMRIQEVLAIPLVPDNFGRRIPRLRVLSNCTGIISDIESVQWQKYRNMDEYKPSLDISNKDYLAALKYALASNLHFEKGNVKMYRRARPAETYGIRPKGREYYRRKFIKK
jgi:hypothetical protein